MRKTPDGWEKISNDPLIYELKTENAHAMVHKGLRGKWHWTVVPVNVQNMRLLGTVYSRKHALSLARIQISNVDRRVEKLKKMGKLPP